MLGALVWLVSIVTSAYWLLLLARVVFSWLMLSPDFRRDWQFHPVVRWVERMTEPVLYPIRRQLSKYDTGPLDLSVFVAMVGVFLVQKILLGILYAIGAH